MDSTAWYGCMSETKWRELRTAMLGLASLSPRWRTKDVENGHVSGWDGDWFYHFDIGGYGRIEWVEIAVTEANREKLEKALKVIHLPGCATEIGFKIFGYVPVGQFVEYV
jgi:hypothetical protein